jgi:hypothetical protein
MTCVIMAILRNAAPGEAHFALPKEKRVVAQLERRGVVSVRRTSIRCGGHLEWWARLCHTEDRTS